MSNKTLSQSHALSVLRPNPMWIPNGSDLYLLYSQFEMLPEYSHTHVTRINILEKNKHSAIHKIRTLPAKIRHGISNPEAVRKILIDFTREATIESEHFIDINGHHHITNSQGKGKPLRSYFDGTSIDLQHATGACIDLEEKTIQTQDPQGIPTKPWILEVLQGAFPNFTCTDLQLKQQKDVHSCALLNFVNLKCFAEGLDLKEHIDHQQLRRECFRQLEEWEIIEEANIHHGRLTPSQNTGYEYGKTPIHSIRYLTF